MTKRTLIFFVIGWLLLTIIEYYFVPYFIVALLWIGLSLTLLIMTIIQLAKLIKERKAITKLRVYTVIVFSTIFYLTFNHSIVNRLIEKVDWKIFYNKRMEVVRQVENNELSPNVSWNGWVCELPFEFPVISNGGNDIGIYRNKKDKSLTVTFWVYRNFFSSPSSCFVYTNDIDEQKELDELVSHNPENNWKIDNNWYRTFGE